MRPPAPADSFIVTLMVARARTRFQSAPQFALMPFFVVTDSVSVGVSHEPALIAASERPHLVSRLMGDVGLLDIVAIRLNVRPVQHQ